MVIDLRTLYHGNLMKGEDLKGVGRLSTAVHDLILDTLERIVQGERDQTYCRQALLQLGQHEAQVSDLVVRVVDSIVRAKMVEILEAVQNAIRRVEKVLTSLQNEANNAT